MPRLIRSEIIDEAHRKLGVLQGATVSAEWQGRAVRVLNAIMAEENDRLVGQEQPFYTERADNLIMVPDRNRYDIGTDAYLSGGLENIRSATWLGDGTATELRLVTGEQWSAIADKDRTGDPEVLWHERSSNAASGFIFVWPVPASITYGSVVTGSTGGKFICLDSHTASDEDKPTSGRSWVGKWERLLGGHPLYPPPAADAWVSGTAYTANPAIRLVTRRALSELDDATDVVDMPRGYDRYVTYRLAYDLSSHFAISLEERMWLKGEYLEARELLFPSTVTGTNDHHNKAIYF